MFIVNLTYKKPLEEVEKYLPDHMVYVNKYYETGNFISSGRKNPRDGGIILCIADSVERIHEIIQEDPFHVNEVASYEVIEFIPSRFETGAITEI